MTQYIRYELKGRRALVTGASSGIGLATATLLARSGAQAQALFVIALFGAPVAAWHVWQASAAWRTL